MGWSQYLPLREPIKEETISEVLTALRAGSGLGLGGWSKQPWGWSAECDIQLKPDKIVFSGAYYSVKTNLPERFTLEAKERGLPVGKLGERS